MANTERLAALAKVRTARNAIQSVLAGSNVSATDRASLDSVVFDLNDLEDLLILADLNDSLDAIKQDGEKLSQTVAAMQAAGNQLADEIAMLDTAAKAVGGLAQVVSIALAHGLVP